jgi:release factor glutamine methyltransferase
MLARRLRREPLAHILGSREFWSLELRVTADTLIPRPETETVVEAALDWAAGREPSDAPGQVMRVLDLGTGSGCLLLALLHELPDAWGVGVDISESALEVARENAVRHQLDDRSAFVCADWADALAGPFDLVVGNPPYIAEGEWFDLPPEVRGFEPRRALLAGLDGVAAYRRIFPELARLLAPTGAAFLEIGGASAGPALAESFAQGLQTFEARSDLAGRPRCLSLRSDIAGRVKNFLGNQAVPV